HDAGRDGPRPPDGPDAQPRFPAGVEVLRAGPRGELRRVAGTRLRFAFARRARNVNRAVAINPSESGTRRPRCVQLSAKATHPAPPPAGGRASSMPPAPPGPGGTPRRTEGPLPLRARPQAADEPPPPRGTHAQGPLPVPLRGPSPCRTVPDPGPAGARRRRR